MFLENPQPEGQNQGEQSGDLPEKESGYLESKGELQISLVSVDKMGENKHSL